MKSLFKKLKLKRRAITFLAGMHFFGNPGKKLKIVGVTGTNGKTTTATLLYRVAMALGYKAGLIGTVENIIDGEVRPATHTTPDPISLHKLLNEMVARGCEYVFMEVSSHAMDQKRVAGVEFAGGIFTNLTHDHLDYHKTFENYFNAKKEFFKMLPARAFALTNADNEYGIKMLAGIKANQFSYGILGGFDDVHFHGDIIDKDIHGLKLSFNKIPIQSRLLGEFNAYNLLAVWSACSLLGFDMKKVNNIIATIEPPKGRFDHFMAPNGVLVVVDYAHTPDALLNILTPVRDLLAFGEEDVTQPNAGKLITVFGCGGDRDPMKRPIMGKLGAEMSDIAIFTSDNPRSEDPEKIIGQMKTDISPDHLKKVRTITNRHEAILEAVKLAQKGDIILCAGKGHEDYQEIKGARHHFDDMEEFVKLYAQK
jgi:UDP-N-acetylmuramoyl-L-alanyl-D-glutamate--2,6-diaminopimelate ligase